MDPDVSLMAHCPPTGGLTQEQVQVEISAEYNRQVLHSHEQKIAAIWQQRKQEKPWLFNGAKFRIHSAQLEGGELLLLRLGLTCYKDYLGTNWAPEARLLQERGVADFGDSQAYLAEPLGVGAMLHTADDCFVFLRRSERVAEAAAQVDIPGGHAEPKAAVKGIPEDSIQVQHLSGELVVQEIFSSILGEIRDEVNVPLESLSRPLLLGIARNHRSAGRPSAEFYVRCKLTSEEVRQRYLIGGVEAHESTSISFVKREDVLKLEEDAESWQELCPSAKGAVKLYTLVRPSWAS
ncbi:uridine diphosphate glucose pyrophosphatase NUDT22 isoform X1 [Chiloscyllium plagiosum]|uniref:uridine diphosphate glucose pyrophosphatase NUDT22 isoform X1 n=1 Tax=Chiloscyllium plagiosum TaxID=36176 RepID=UPI001CB7C4CF|nr:uridine diphosphate glucose pyrophosphatase NUDT22 isoform X1 [Chiloscyllium plagiosum]XP_043538571.1 uridine diphosphate glucose pyrophosphatase NUDT22 isoform X1 [Chiloscyllium plagiosum]XP_043538572.1 uridine diphosphate glucose pyrophosphatase NUDT22 isoform X1 [Chiloscyllium plagiosum]XP_043538573.1 uridine diphosphate glucose pyrophosphatase NUDT22 isoform X1 [Chiloscyllium plagiosum]XP_043538574.1 uridine diphosphate glucose pyrophosphatase NUDT22 isoform X1 [Chiloscyllium plagiosum]